MGVRPSPGPCPVLSGTRGRHAGVAWRRGPVARVVRRATPATGRAGVSGRVATWIGQVLGHALDRPQRPLAPQRHPLRVQPCGGRARHEQLVGVGEVDQPGGDVDVDAEPVAADGAGTAGVQAGPQPRPVPGDLDARRSRVRGLVQRRRRPAAGRGRRPSARRPSASRPGRGRRAAAARSARRDLAQQPQRGLVAGAQRPVGEADEVGEQQRHLAVAAARGRCAPGTPATPAARRGRPRATPAPASSNSRPATRATTAPLSRPAVLSGSP